MANAPGVRTLELGPNERDHGVIVTVREQQSGELRTIHEPGSTRVALRAVAQELDRLNTRPDQHWLISCISTPRTIYRDLQGSRDSQRERMVRHDSDLGSDDGERHAEHMILGLIGRRDLLEPKRRPVTAEETPGRRAATGATNSDTAGARATRTSVRPGWQRRLA